MNKLLTTIILIFFSVVANAETWVCSHIASNEIITRTFERKPEGFFTLFGLEKIAAHSEDENTLYLYENGSTKTEGRAANFTWIIDKQTWKYVMQLLRLDEFESDEKFSGSCEKIES
jgi:hypothetical protein